MNINTLIENISGIGPIYQKKLKKLGIETTKDLLYYFPQRYEDFSNVIPISQVKLNENVSIKGEIENIENIRTWKRKMAITEAIIKDKSGSIEITWFNQPYITNNLKRGDLICLSGKVSVNTGKKKLPQPYISNPAYEKISDEKDLIHVGRIVPIYSESARISSRWLRYIIRPLLQAIKGKIQDTIPKEIIEKEKLLPLEKALWQIHFPDSLELAGKAKNRFAFEELLNISLVVLRERIKLKQSKAIEIPFNLRTIQRFTKSLPFKLTDGQKKSAWQILKDLEKPRPMNRLLEGDVGSGKTVVAAIAALNVVKAGYQVAFMAPTEILSKQHFKEVFSLLNKFNLDVGLLTGKEDKFYSKKLKYESIEISRKKLLEKAENKDINILIGTHALISAGGKKSKQKNKREPVKFGGLALVILDEQHRFGVEQRAKLCRNKEFIPHLLSMTATPIPRTLALTIYGDLDLSLIPELPKGRKKIITEIVPPDKREATYKFIKKEVKKGRQVFVICPRIDSEKKKNKENEITTEKENNNWSEVKAVKQEYEKLSKEIFPNLNIEMLHGKMKSKEKENIMQRLKNKKIDVLVSTSVIEVGIDIPNATVMMIEGAERFGLAQLHQFRGRVGRSKYQSYCFLFTDSKSQKTWQRLKAILKAKNSFELAEKDLEIRGPGSLDGKRQWGIADLTMASLKNISLVEKTREIAKEILEKDPELKRHPLLKEKIGEFRERIHLE